MVKSKSQELKQIYKKLKPKITKRLHEFEHVWTRNNGTQLFEELCFCLLTPQTKAENCYNAVLKLRDEGLLFIGEVEQIEDVISDSGVRFKKHKAKYIVNTRKNFDKIKGVIEKDGILKENSDQLRSWLVKNVCGFGYKEASHFLRNIGLGNNFALLDRHVLKNLKTLGVIKKIPDSLTEKKYFEIENRLKTFAKKINIPVSHLDLLFWAKETGKILK